MDPAFTFEESSATQAAWKIPGIEEALREEHKEFRTTPLESKIEQQLDIKQRLAKRRATWKKGNVIDDKPEVDERELLRAGKWDDDVEVKKTKRRRKKQDAFPGSDGEINDDAEASGKDSEKVKNVGDKKGTSNENSQGKETEITNDSDSDEEESDEETINLKDSEKTVNLTVSKVLLQEISQKMDILFPSKKMKFWHF